MSHETPTISCTEQPTATQKDFILSLWNKEYPAQLGYKSMSELDGYLHNLNSPKHYFAKAGDSIVGWSFCFLRDEETWFAIIVDSKYQGFKTGSALLNCLKADCEVLNGWVTDHKGYVKADGSRYSSPLAFYQKHSFEVLHDTRLEIPKLSAVKIKWRRS